MYVNSLMSANIITYEVQKNAQEMYVKFPIYIYIYILYCCLQQQHIYFV